MFTVKNYVVAESLEQAYQLNQEKNNAVVGGMLWLRMGTRRIKTVIDLSHLDLDKIEEDEKEFQIGCMCTLHDLETHERLGQYFDGVFKNAVEHIVGVQFRNMATVGGSVFSRFGFSDLSTVLMAFDCQVELYKGGVVSIADFMEMPRDRDILIRIHIKKDDRKVAYFTHRLSATDFPVLTCAVAKKEEKWKAVIGARPMKAVMTEDLGLPEDILNKKKEVTRAIDRAVGRLSFGANMRAGKEYREVLAKALLQKGIEKIAGGCYED